MKWLLEAAGGEGLATIAGSLGSRRASARCALAFWNGSSVDLFVGETAGEILTEPRGQGGFGWDAWFLAEASGLTYAEMNGREKDQISHRGKAFALLRRLLSPAV